MFIPEVKIHSVSDIVHEGLNWCNSVESQIQSDVSYLLWGLNLFIKVSSIENKPVIMENIYANTSSDKDHYHQYYLLFYYIERS